MPFDWRIPLSGAVFLLASAAACGTEQDFGHPVTGPGADAESPPVTEDGGAGDLRADAGLEAEPS